MRSPGGFRDRSHWTCHPILAIVILSSGSSKENRRPCDSGREFLTDVNDGGTDHGWPAESPASVKRRA